MGAVRCLRWRGGHCSSPARLGPVFRPVGAPAPCRDAAASTGSMLNCVTRWLTSTEASHLVSSCFSRIGAISAMPLIGVAAKNGSVPSRKDHSGSHF